MAALILPVLCPAVFAQTAKGDGATAASSAPSASADLSGVWEMHMPASARHYINFAFTAEEPPMTAWAEAKFKASKPSFGPRVFAIQDTNDPVYHGCFPPGVPRVYLHPFPMQILVTPGQVTMLFEYDSLRRIIYTDGRSHNEGLPATWMGESIGHWEGDTLVVDTDNFNDQTWLDRMGHPHSDQLHVIERMRRVDKNTLQIDMTFEDPKAYTKPWSTQLIYQLKPNWTLLEQFCEDNDTFNSFESKETTSAK